MKPDFYKNYYKNNEVYTNKIKELQKNGFTLLKNNIHKIMYNLNRNINILEIGSGNGSFANYCHELGFKKYIGFELDKKVAKQTQKSFPDYKFYTTDILKFLEYKENNFDIIFISHVFEHLNEKQANETVKLIYNSLNKGGCRINYMPNADSYLNASTLRYIDITHKKLYNTNSLEQIVLTNEAKYSQIQFLNTLPAIDPYIKLLFKVIHPLFLWATKIYFYGMGFSFPKIYTSEILSIARK